MVEIDKKREQIIEGAIKRFIHFGINKTTMNEIADDLSVSKPSLYYYFPDKTSLIIGVLDKIFSDFFEIVDKEYEENAHIEKTLLNLIEVGHRFFQKYYMLHLSGGSPDSSLNSAEVKNHIMEMKKRNQALHSRIFQKAAEKGEIENVEIEKVSDLYLSTQSGITSLCIMQGNKELFPSKKELKALLEKQMNLCKIFLNGLKNKNQ
jgi:AcrR family transcriptional regulator